MLDVMGSLTDASLVRRSDLTGDVRYSMLETIREFAGERLDAAGEREAVGHGSRPGRDRWRSGPSHTSSTPSRSTGSPCWSASTTTSAAALDVAERNGDDRTAVEAGLRTSAAIWRFWQERGHLSEGEARLARLLDLPEAQHPDEARARAWEGTAGSCTGGRRSRRCGSTKRLRRSAARSAIKAASLGIVRPVVRRSLADDDFEAGERILHEALEAWVRATAPAQSHPRRDRLLADAARRGRRRGGIVRAGDRDAAQHRR